MDVDPEVAVSDDDRPLTQDQAEALGLDGRDGHGTYTYSDLSVRDRRNLVILDQLEIERRRMP